MFNQLASIFSKNETQTLIVFWWFTGNKNSNQTENKGVKYTLLISTYFEVCLRQNLYDNDFNIKWNIIKIY